ncbi:phage Gp37/Gp68 family protein (plasmid) [Streptomyces sp. BH-SS-21]|uniref:Phage Gp37/Gp68 family protein n=1 Tax=Streptomyces liliiviolaceus TaxID=2823109 RepID=A0A940YF48_9ACTN|nr:phage Gp37/Gp68 family protein [Streptomyces liliiviolaceus]MBQ0855744.1 phage Gp37/Gp68 family protein [Streptomyces liliiviolaceus]
MADTTGIEWTDSTWNPTTGCEKISDGCTNCYAATFAERWRGIPGHHFEAGFDITLRPERLRLPMTWRTPRRIFLDSMSDLFHQDISDTYIAQVFAMMALTSRHTYQVLTKRHARMKALLSRATFWHQVAEQGREHFAGCQEEWLAAGAMLGGEPLPNVWLGVSVEDQRWADIRIPALLGTPAHTRFLSCEPLLGPVWIADHIWQACPCCEGESHDEACARCADQRCESGHIRRLDWVIAGGESGPGARPLHPDWIRSLRDQTRGRNVPFFFKQWGDHAPEDHGHDRGRLTVVDPRGHGQDHDDPCASQTPVRMRRVGKKQAGRLLDGRHHDAFPAPAR